MEFPWEGENMCKILSTRENQGKGKRKRAEARTRIGSQGDGIGPQWERRAKKRSRKNNETKQLLPGIPDDITMTAIASKLPWSAFHTLASVSPSWRQAIQSRALYHARLMSHSTEKFLLHMHSSFALNSVIALYSMREKRCYRLPGIPHVQRGIPWESKCISVDGKIYVIGGCKEVMRDDGSPEESAEVYVFDLAGQRQWKCCPRMQEPRQKFGCDVLDGKIYVFGGFSHGDFLCTSEMFDPKENVWSSILAMITARIYPRVRTFGKQVFIYGGFTMGGNRGGNELEFDGSVEVYHSVELSWTKLKLSLSRPRNLEREMVDMFMAEGKFYLVTKSGIHCKGADDDLWEELQSFSFPPIREGRNNWTSAWMGDAPVLVNHEVLLAVQHPGPAGSYAEVDLVQSRGFVAGKEMSWEILPRCPLALSVLLSVLEL